MVKFNFLKLYQFLTKNTKLKMNSWCLVTNKVVENNFEIGYFYVDYSININDSGLRLMFGDESQDYIDNPENSKIYLFSSVLKKCNKLEFLYKENLKIGDEYEYHTESFKKISL